MNRDHFRLWQTSSSIETEEMRLICEIDYPPGSLPEYVTIIPWGDKYRLFVEKPPLPGSHFDTFIADGEIITVRHVGTMEMSVHYLEACIETPMLLFGMSIEHHILDMPNNLYILRGLQYAKDPDNEMTPWAYWALEMVKWVLRNEAS